MLLADHEDEDEKASSQHPYLEGNFAPIYRTLPLTPCAYEGELPAELAGGQYVRNGGNPLKNDELGRAAHWFDGDGMLSGVLFRRAVDGRLAPEFVNQFILTDVHRAARAAPGLRRPLLPSIATLIDPARSVLAVLAAILRTLVLVALSWLPGGLAARGRAGAIKRISVANTGVLYHDGRALATCESGPPLRVLLPGLETVGWFNGRRAENEPDPDPRPGYGGGGALNFLTEWTTGHPRVDPATNELISFHATFVPPYVRYSIVPATGSDGDGGSDSDATAAGKPRAAAAEGGLRPPIFNVPIPGVSGAKMMHDFGVSLRHTVILDLPLTLDPARLLRGRPPVAYDPAGVARFGVFPRYHPERVRWFATRACCIFHTANTWETTEKVPGGAGAGGGAEMDVVHMLACRLTSAAMVFSAGNLPAPAYAPPLPGAPGGTADEQCRLYYYQFPLPADPRAAAAPTIRHQWALSAIPFDFPSARPAAAMAAARYFYGCTTTAATFTAALGRAAKIDALAKLDAQTLIARGLARPPPQVDGCVDLRGVREASRSTDPADPVQVFVLPPGRYAQEPRFVARRNGIREDDGWLLSYVFDENAGLDPTTGMCRPDARSELWVIDARTMRHVVARVTLPQRVPYGLHGNWFDEAAIRGQRPVAGVRRLLDAAEAGEEDVGEGKGARVQARRPLVRRAWLRVRGAIEGALA